MPLAPIVLFTYNRLSHTQRTIEALCKNALAIESELFIYSDAPKNKSDIKAVIEVRNYIKTIKGFKKITIIERETNLGLASSIIDGVTKIVNEYDKIIVLEDDLITHQNFLTFMNTGLEIYEQIQNVISIHGFVYPIPNLPETFFLRGADCWGWATWKRGWDIFNPDGHTLLSALHSNRLTTSFDFNNSYPFTKMLNNQIAGKNNSWAIRWHASAFLANMLTLYPSESLIRNIGYDIGTHCGGDTSDNNCYGVLSNQNIICTQIEAIECKACTIKYEEFFRSQRKSLFHKLISKIIRFFK